MRDMTEREFKAALERNGFKLLAAWMMDARTGAGMAGYGMVTVRGRLNYRASLAHALRSRDLDDAKRDEAARRKEQARRDLAATLGVDADSGALLADPLGRLADTTPAEKALAEVVALLEPGHDSTVFIGRATAARWRAIAGGIPQEEA